jgi:hypothetical protein
MFVRLSAASAALAAAGMLLAPAAASAQTYSYQGPAQYDYGYAQPYGQDRYDDRYGYDRNSYEYCRSNRSQRGAAGGVVGATIGAIAGSQLGANGRRTEASILGGVLGAAIGASVGTSSGGRDGVDCDRYHDQSRYSYDTAPYDNRAYGYGAYDPRYEQGRAYDPRYEQGRAYDYNRTYANDGYGDPYACRTVETRSYDRYGRLVTRYEQSCPDRY